MALTFDTDNIPLNDQVRVAARAVAPCWPLTSFVAVNPLGGLENLPFDDACTEAARTRGAATYMDLDWYREAYHQGRISRIDLIAAIVELDPYLAACPPLTIGTRAVDAVDVVVTDLVDGPSASPAASATRDPVGDYVADWCASYVHDAHAGMDMPGRSAGLFGAWSRLAGSDRALRRVVGRDGWRWIRGLPDDAADALDVALTRRGVTSAGTEEALSALVGRLPGWAGYAKWCEEWAPSSHTAPRLSLIDVTAMLAVVAAAAGESLAATPELGDTGADVALLEDRISAALDGIGHLEPTDDDRTAVASLLEQVPNRARAAIWLSAHERRYRDDLLHALTTSERRPRAEVSAQVVTCIDVRSETLRRHLESSGDIETFGVAGFFGIPMHWRPAGSTHLEARCPVLISPEHEVSEHAEPGADAPSDIRHRMSDAFHNAKADVGGPFALAESLGWAMGPMALARTLRPSAVAPGPTPAASLPDVAGDHHPGTGFALQDRVDMSERLLVSLGLEPLVPLVVLCGHAAHTTNNAHSASLQCGACGGAPGGASSRVAAALLNDSAVRAELAERGHPIPDETWFVAAEHDTVTDTVHILDEASLPPDARRALDGLRPALDEAKVAAATERSQTPGLRDSPHRGTDWAEVRPEWGLAGNAAFVIGPRSITDGASLEGRVFLHSYEADLDQDGTVLETILGGPLVVAQWINSQYYFSTVDQGAFGAGDKLLHNPIGGVGVVLGTGGDLATGLPQQSVMAGDTVVHEPLRLLALVAAPMERIDAVLDAQPHVRRLVENSWVRLGALDDDGQWYLRTPAGSWEAWHERSVSFAAS